MEIIFLPIFTIKNALPLLSPQPLFCYHVKYQISSLSLRSNCNTSSSNLILCQTLSIFQYEALDISLSNTDHIAKYIGLISGPVISQFNILKIPRRYRLHQCCFYWFVVKHSNFLSLLAKSATHLLPTFAGKLCSFFLFFNEHQGDLGQSGTILFQTLTSIVLSRVKKVLTFSEMFPSGIVHWKTSYLTKRRICLLYTVFSTTFSRVG